MPRADTKTQVENDLDANLRVWRESELSAIALDTISLRDTSTSIDDLLEVLEAHLASVRQLAIEVCCHDAINDAILRCHQ